MAQPRGSTLLDLVTALAPMAETPEAIVAAVHALLDSGEVQLTGNFRGSILRDSDTDTKEQV